LGQGICLCMSVYYYTITMYGNPNALLKAPASFCTVMLFSGIIAPVVQSFFTYRLRILSGHLWIAAILWFASFVRFISTVLLAAVSYQMVSYVTFAKQWRWLLLGTVIWGACVDVSIAALLYYYLGKQRRDSFKETVQIIDSLIMWTIETGALTSLNAVLVVIMFLVISDSYWWTIFSVISSRLFSSSMLASLNARIHLTALRHNGISNLDTTRGRSLVFNQTPGVISIRMDGIDGSGSINSAEGEEETYVDHEPKPRELQSSNTARGAEQSARDR